MKYLTDFSYLYKFMEKFQNFIIIFQMNFSLLNTFLLHLISMFLRNLIPLKLIDMYEYQIKYFKLNVC